MLRLYLTNGEALELLHSVVAAGGGMRRAARRQARHPDARPGARGQCWRRRAVPPLHAVAVSGNTCRQLPVASLRRRCSLGCCRRDAWHDGAALRLAARSKRRHQSPSAPIST
jgi:hypothetical protein